MNIVKRFWWPLVTKNRYVKAVHLPFSKLPQYILHSSNATQLALPKSSGDFLKALLYNPSATRETRLPLQRLQYIIPAFTFSDTTLHCCHYATVRRVWYRVKHGFPFPRPRTAPQVRDQHGDPPNTQTHVQSYISKVVNGVPTKSYTLKPLLYSALLSLLLFEIPLSRIFPTLSHTRLSAFRSEPCRR